jgi:hypothetical protein
MLQVLPIYQIKFQMLQCRKNNVFDLFSVEIEIEIKFHVKYFHTNQVCGHTLLFYVPTIEVIRQWPVL